MNKRIILPAVFALPATAIFAHDFVDTAEGSYGVGISYQGKIDGAKFYNGITNHHLKYPDVVESVKTTNVKLSKGQWECVKRALNRYDTEKGEVYNFMIVHEDIAGILCVTCEFTSATQYSYWACSVKIKK